MNHATKPTLQPKVIKRNSSSCLFNCSIGGLNSLTHALANSLGPLVRVNSVCPGWIECGNYNQLRESDHS